MSRSKTAAVVIPHYNDTRRLLRCLAALEPQVADAEVDVFVIDNGSDEPIQSIIESFPWVRLLIEPEKGAAAARNRGVQASNAKLLFFTDADCVPAADWIETALRLGVEDQIVGGRVLLFDETPPPRSGAEAFETIFAFPQEMYVTRKKFSVTANLLTTRKVFDHVGPFDGGVVEDHDWCMRAGKLGYDVIYRPELTVSHPTRSTWQDLRRKWFRTNNENYFLNGTSKSARAFWALRGLIVLVSGPAHLPRVARATNLTISERLGAAATLLRLRTARSAWMLRQAVFGDRRI